MNVYEIKNEFLTVKVEDLGAQLLSLCGKDGTEYLWQGDPAYWEDRSPILFPYIARMTDKKYQLFGKTYEMDIHGFAKDTVFTVVEQTADKLIFRMTSDETTYAQYPYTFTFDVIYTLEENQLRMDYRVENQDEKTMYFGIGGHPGINVPFAEGTVFEDYELVFDVETEANRIGMSDDCFVTGEEIEFPLLEKKRLPLQHNLFDHDAIIFKDMPKGISLRSDKTQKVVHVTYPDVTYLGLWHAVETDAPYVCIEPWSSLPSRKGIVEDLATQPSIVSLESGKEYRSRIGIAVQE